MTQILVTKPGALTRADKQKLRAAGCIAVEAENPQDVRLISVEGPTLDANDMIFAALSAMANPSGNLASDVRQTFPVVLLKLMKEVRFAASPEASQ